MSNLHKQTVLILSIFILTGLYSCSDQKLAELESTKRRTDKVEETLTDPDDDFDLLPDIIRERFSSFILLDNPSSADYYVGAAYPESVLKTMHLSKELTYPKNPTEYIFDFYPEPFISQTTERFWSRGYLNSLKDAVMSNEFNLAEEAQNKDFSFYQQCEYKSYSQLENVFPGRNDIGKLFAKEVEENGKGFAIKGRLFYFAISQNFSSYMDIQPKGFFAEPKYNQKETYDLNDQPVYIKSLIYGNIAYAAIESEYSTEELEWAIKKAKAYDLDPKKIMEDRKVSDIFSKTIITAFSPSSISSLGIPPCTIQKFDQLFKFQQLGMGSIGKPIFAQFLYIHNNAPLTNN